MDCFQSLSGEVEGGQCAHTSAGKKVLSNYSIAFGRTIGIICIQYLESSRWQDRERKRALERFHRKPHQEFRVALGKNARIAGAHRKPRGGRVDGLLMHCACEQLIVCPLEPG